MDATLQLAALRVAGNCVRWVRNEMRSCSGKGGSNQARSSEKVSRKERGGGPVISMGHIDSDRLGTGMG
jgi:hypothetical protein